MVIGGGPCGLEASAQLHKMGYNVILIEKEKQLGGHLAKWDRLFPEGIEAKEVLQPLVDNINGVKYFLDTEVVSINLLDKEYNVILSNGITVLSKAVLMTSGFDLFPAEKKEEYGYGIYDRVITNADLEKFFATGKDPRVVENPKRIGFVHCVGSRDEKAGNRYCSKVCCATAVKQACEMKALFPDAEIFCFYMDLRMFGKKYEDFYISAQRDYGIRFIRGRVSEVGENIDGQVIVKAEDTLAGKPVKVTLDLLVLMAGMVCNKDSSSIAGMVSLQVDSDGFFKSRDNIADITESSKDGIYYAGACTGPKTVPETLAEARSAALEIHSYINRL